ncbi:MAG: DUF72 domain-containing protein [Candidatus Krumholzibacteriales bacterium]
MIKTEKRKRIFTGPAGWSYDDWSNIFYPAGSRIDRLGYTAGYFDCVELNSSFYRIPSAGMVTGWVERISSHSGFMMTVKAFGKFTHERNLDQAGVREFTDVFEPLRSSGRLGALLFQFPWSFRNLEDSRRHLMKIGNLFRDYPLVAELRHGSWNSGDSFRLLSDYGFTLCSIDQPMIGDSMPPSIRVTNSSLGYIRLHGRNRKDWFRKEAGRDQRYDYLYSEDEMEEWASRAGELSGKADRLFIITNNHFRGQALVNAFQLKSIMEERKLDTPQPLKREYPVLEKISLPPSGQQNLPGFS